MRNPAALLLPLLMLAAPAFADDAKPRTITTTGTATVYVVPDEAMLRLSVHTFDKDLPKSKQMNDAAAAEVLAFIKEIGIDLKDVQTSYVTSQAVYEPRRENGQVTRGPITGYTVNRSYSVKLRDISKLDLIYDKLLPDERVTLQGHMLSTSESRKYRDQARIDAAKAAREKAELLAGALGAGVGQPREITESSADAIPNYRQNTFAVGGYARGGGGEEDSSPVGQIEVKAEVTVTFDLVPKETKE